MLERTHRRTKPWKSFDYSPRGWLNECRALRLGPMCLTSFRKLLTSFGPGLLHPAVYYISSPEIRDLTKQWVHKCRKRKMRNTNRHFKKTKRLPSLIFLFARSLGKLFESDGSFLGGRPVDSLPHMCMPGIRLLHMGEEIKSLETVFFLKGAASHISMHLMWADHLVLVGRCQAVIEHFLVENRRDASWHGRHNPHPVSRAAASHPVLVLHVLHEGLSGWVVVHDGHFARLTTKHGIHMLSSWHWGSLRELKVGIFTWKLWRTAMLTSTKALSFHREEVFLVSKSILFATSYEVNKKILKVTSTFLVCLERNWRLFFFCCFF